MQEKIKDDTISRQAAIDALDCINGTEEVLRSLPSAQPEPCEDAVSRQDAIIQLSHNKNGDPDCDVIIQHDIETLKQLPSVTPKPKVYCKECKHYDPSTWKEDSGWCNVEDDCETGIEMTPDDYCSRGERR